VRLTLVPLEKVSNSKTPAGPFQMTVLEASTFSRKSAIDAGPQSMPSHLVRVRVRVRLGLRLGLGLG